MYHAMKHALRSRRGRDIHMVMTPAEDHEAMGLAPDAKHDLSAGAHGHEMAESKEDMAKHLLDAAHMHADEGPAEESKEDMARMLLDQAHDNEGDTNAMSHSGKVMDGDEEGEMAAAKGLSAKAKVRAKHLSMKGK